MTIWLKVFEKYKIQEKCITKNTLLKYFHFIDFKYKYKMYFKYINNEKLENEELDF